MKPVRRKGDFDDEKIKTILAAERANSLGSDASSDLSAQRMRALDYYMGDVSGDMPDEEGLSNAVSSDVQDAVEGILPIILDALTGAENIVEFKPRGAGDSAAAAQETEYVNHVFYQQNAGFLTLHTVVKDGLLQKNGFVKWWMEPDESRTRESYKALTEDAFAMLTADDEVKLVDSEEYTDTDPATKQPATFYNAVVERKITKLRPRVGPVPPEELLVSKTARTLQSSGYIAHIQHKPQADIIALFPEKAAEIKAAPGAPVSADNNEAFNRETVQDNEAVTTGEDTINRDMRLIELAEHYVRLSLEEDNVARKYKITTVGPQAAVILDIEEVSSWPFATGTPILMSHRVFGRAIADLFVDLQQIKTSLLRSTLNNAYFANNQRIEVSETHASENTLDDLLNNRVGGIVRTKMPGGLNQIETQSIGGWVGQIMDRIDAVGEKRSGISKANQSLDVDSLNHARTGAVSRLMDAAEMRVKLIARIFAETLLVDMFRGIHGMLQEYAEEAEEVELSGQWVTVDPREWKKREHMKVTLPLGGASKQQLLGFFAQLLQGQKEVIALQGGPNGPLVNMTNVFNAFEQMTKLAGVPSVTPFFSRPDPNAPPPPPPPDPAMVKANAQAEALKTKTAADQASNAQQLQFEQALEGLKARLAHERETDKFEHKAALDKMKFEHDREMAELKTAHDLAVQRFKTTEEAKLNEQQARLDQQENVVNV